MALNIAFDIYGTLINTQGVVTELEKHLTGTHLQDKAHAFANTWRDKQLEYAFRRALMQNYQPFSTCISEALDYTCKLYQAQLSKAQKESLLQAYQALPAFDDVSPGLSALTQARHRLYAFSNGTLQAVNCLLARAQLIRHFDGIISVDEVKSFKPNPAVYSHLLRSVEANHGDLWLVSSNPFDVIGAVSAGMHAAWVQRQPSQVFDPWGIEPDITVQDLPQLADKLAQ